MECKIDQKFKYTEFKSMLTEQRNCLIKTIKGDRKAERPYLLHFLRNIIARQSSLDHEK